MDTERIIINNKNNNVIESISFMTLALEENYLPFNNVFVIWFNLIKVHDTHQWSWKCHQLKTVAFIHSCHHFNNLYL